MTEDTIESADLFCGAGGTSTGLFDAAAEKGLAVKMVAVNHDPVACATYELNHPQVKPLCQNLDNVDPRAAVPGRHLHVMVGSAECTYHSNAVGGMPINDQSRASAFHITRWADALNIDNIIIENVPEFRDWGPIDENKKRIKKLKGQTYLAFLNMLRSMGYNVEDRVLCCANFGDATTRQRLFIICRKGDQPITWPEPTHAKPGLHKDLFGERKPWRSAREILDLEDRGTLISERKSKGLKPLVDNTMRRIIKGFFKTNGLPFILGQQSQAAARSVDDPLPTIATAGGQHFGLATPYLSVYHGGKAGEDRVSSIDNPLPTIDTSNRYSLIQPYIVAVNHGKDDSRSYPLDRPMPTITTVDAWGVATPYIVKYYGSGSYTSVEEPLDTITTKDRFGLVTPIAVYLKDGTVLLVDFYYRMLKPSELAAATSFPEDYEFVGPRDKVVWQIGNAVPVKTAKAVTSTVL